MKPEADDRRFDKRLRARARRNSGCLTHVAQQRNDMRHSSGAVSSPRRFQSARTSARRRTQNYPYSAKSPN